MYCMVAKTGKRIRNERVPFPVGKIADSYNYLGIPQADKNKDTITRSLATAKYIQRVRWLLKSQLNGRNKIQAINICTLPTIRYPAGVMSWPQEETDVTDVKTWKLLAVHGGFQLPETLQTLIGGQALLSVYLDIRGLEPLSRMSNFT